jgi:hypothetical protein
VKRRSQSNIPGYSLPRNLILVAHSLNTYHHTTAVSNETVHGLENRGSIPGNGRDISLCHSLIRGAGMAQSL